MKCKFNNTYNENPIIVCRRLAINIANIFLLELNVDNCWHKEADYIKL